MAVRGRRVIPFDIHKRAGNPGKRPLRVGEPVAEGVPKKPSWVKGRVAEIFDEVVSVAPWLKSSDSIKLALLAELYSRFEKPKLRAKMKATDFREIRNAAGELGLDPMSRARFGQPPTKPTKPTPIGRNGDQQKAAGSKYLT